jgi:diacylglycerol kinase
METAPNVFIPRIFDDHSWKGTRGALKTEEAVVILTLIFCTVALLIYLCPVSVCFFVGFLRLFFIFLFTVYLSF